MLASSHPEHEGARNRSLVNAELFQSGVHSFSKVFRDRNR